MLVTTKKGLLGSFWGLTMGLLMIFLIVDQKAQNTALERQEAIPDCVAVARPDTVRQWTVQQYKFQQEEQVLSLWFEEPEIQGEGPDYTLYGVQPHTLTASKGACQPGGTS